MNIVAIAALQDNYIWAIIKDDQAVLVDVGEASPVLDFLQNQGICPVGVLITHDHNDHIGGVATLKQAYPNCLVYAHNDHKLDKDVCVSAGETVRILGLGFEVSQSNGHTDCHLTYTLKHNGVHVFCGDTLFRAGCGRVFTGTMHELFDSFCAYHALADETLFYPAHEYTLANLAFAQHLEPANQAILATITKDKNTRLQDKPTLPTSLGEERMINPFVRAVSCEAQLYEAAKRAGYDGDKDALKLFGFLRKLKDNF